MTARPGYVRLRDQESRTSLNRVSILARKLTSLHARITTKMEFHPEIYQHSAGLILYYDNMNYINLRKYYSQTLGQSALSVICLENGEKTEFTDTRTPVGEGPVYLRLYVEQRKTWFEWSCDGTEFQKIGRVFDTSCFSDEYCRYGEFTGTMAGLTCADRMFHRHYADYLFGYLDRVRGSKFDGSILDLFYEADTQFSMLACLDEEKDFHKILPDVRLSEQECEDYLRMMIYAIDFRSQHTVTHTITTTRISCCAARHMGLSEEQIHNIFYGALLHDLGKIGIPVKILEYPGRLSNQAMAIMRTHVDRTEEILGGTIEEGITRIALRHHEKLDGSGYPRGLCGEALTIEERIVAVSDIVSALLGTRSYKEAFSKNRTLSIIEEQAREGKIDKSVVEVLRENFDVVLEEVEESCRPILDTYYGLRKEYQYLLGKYLYDGAKTADKGRKES